MATDSLRSRQKQMARESILQATADEIVEKGIEDLSLQDVADRAGVAKRTLYNYFDSREALLAALNDWSNQLTLEHGGSLAPNGLDGLDDVVRALWRSWHAQGSVYQAVVAIDAATRNGKEVSDGRRERRQAFADGVQAVQPELGDADALRLGAVMHALVSAPVFHRLTVEDDLEVDDAAGLVGWLADVMREALERGDDPFAFRGAQGESNDDN